MGLSPSSSINHPGSLNGYPGSCQWVPLSGYPLVFEFLYCYCRYYQLELLYSASLGEYSAFPPLLSLLSHSMDLDEARNQSAALFSQLQQGNRQLLENYRPGYSEYRDRFIAWPLEKRSSPIRPTAGDNSLRLGADGFGSCEWGSELRTRFPRHEVGPPSPRKAHTQQPTENIVSVNRSAKDWNSETHEKYIAHEVGPAPTRIQSTKTEESEGTRRLGEESFPSAEWRSEVADKYVAHEPICMGEGMTTVPGPRTSSLGQGDTRFSSKDWASEMKDRYPQHEHSVSATMIRPPQSSVGRSDEGSSESQWQSETKDKYSLRDIPASPAVGETAATECPPENADLAKTSGSLPSSSELVSRPCPLIAYEEHSDPSKWRSNYGDMCVNQGHETAQATAGRANDVCDPVPSNFAWDSDTSEQAIKGKSEYSENYTKKELPAASRPTDRPNISESPLVNYSEFPSSAWKSNYQHQCENTHIETHSNEHDTANEAKEGCKDSPAQPFEGQPTGRQVMELSSPLALYDQFMDAAQWISTYRVMCSEVDKISPPKPIIPIGSGNPLPNYPDYSPAVWKSSYKEFFDSVKMNSESASPSRKRVGAAEAIPLQFAWDRLIERSSDNREPPTESKPPPLKQIVDPINGKSPAFMRGMSINEYDDKDEIPKSVVPSFIPSEDEMHHSEEEGRALQGGIIAPKYDDQGNVARPNSPSVALDATDGSQASKSPPSNNKGWSVSRLPKSRSTEARDAYRWPAQPALVNFKGKSQATLSTKGEKAVKDEVRSESNEMCAWTKDTNHASSCVPKSNLMVQGAQLVHPIETRSSFISEDSLDPTRRMKLASETPSTPTNLLFGKPHTSPENSPSHLSEKMKTPKSRSAIKGFTPKTEKKLRVKSLSTGKRLFNDRKVIHPTNCAKSIKQIRIQLIRYFTIRGIHQCPLINQDG